MIVNAEGAHLAAYFESLAQADEVESVALADSTGATVAQARQALGEKLTGTFDDTRRMLREARPAMVLVSLEAALAPAEIDAALEAGCHVLAEKPACVRAEDFRPLVHKADSKHLHLMLALANRLHAPVREARRLIEAGRLGKIYGVEMHLVADQTRLTREEYRRSWFASKARAGGGHLIWLGIHWLDLATHITGLAVREVACLTAVVGGQEIDVEDSAAVLLRFDNGSLGTLTSGYYLDQGYHSHIAIWGEHGWLRLGDLDTAPLEHYSTAAGAPATVERFEYPAGQGGYAPFVRAAVRASAGLQDAPVTGTDSLRVLETIFACYRAATTGAVQSVS
jgi:predicted dehydrogenase